MARPIIAEAVKALEAFKVEHAADAVVLLRMWSRVGQLTADDFAEVLAHFPGRINVGDGFAEGYLAAMQHARRAASEDLLADQPDEIRPGLADVDVDAFADAVEADLRADGGDR